MAKEDAQKQADQWLEAQGQPATTTGNVRRSGGGS
jgi:hypothetical protein